MYRYVIKLSDGSHRVGVAPSMAYCTSEIWEIDWDARKKKLRITNIDIWRCKK